MNPLRLPNLSKLKWQPYRFAGFLFILAIILSVGTRLALLLKSWKVIDFTLLNLLRIFVIGFFYDLVSAAWTILPLMLYTWLLPSKVFVKRSHRVVLYGIFFAFTFGLLFNVVSEWFFWDEFSSRFNFIAVDYLVYTNEVIGNIRQSYPVEIIIVGLLLFSVGILLLLRRHIQGATQKRVRFKERTLVFVPYCMFVIGVYFFVNNKLRQASDNTYVNELSGNGLYELFAAYFNNELDYEQFYNKIPNEVAFRYIRKFVKTPESEFVNSDSLSIERLIVNSGKEKRMNVVMISVESLSGEFLAAFGNTQRITPNLDSLANHSLFFTNLYATGTRTVRGLEALSICTPPTPGQSIVRRPDNEDLFSLGKIFEQKGYQSKFIYGGYGYFDNMGYFFGHNHYEVADRSKINNKDIDYENIWGVADENLFTLATTEIEKTIQSGKPIFAHIMTTSNHRPFTYPEGRIDIPSHTSREGAVKYTDYAIGKFIRAASKKSWFKNTMFVIIADHCASSAGKTDLPVSKYHIPLLIYSPGFISPAKMDRLMSQIDLGPTVLGLLNFSYRSKFFGYDIFKLEPGRERAFISTYQNLGYLRNDTLIVLKPQRLSGSFIPNYRDGSVKETQKNISLTIEAITWYQTASYQFKHHLMN
jgi:phosphoglycerol transferase MdoB-like AlkP superfamily enzyme